MRVYSQPLIRALEAFYGDVLKVWKYPSTDVFLEAYRDKFGYGIETGEPAVYAEVSNYHPEYAGASIDILKSKPSTDLLRSVPREFGFQSWADSSARVEPIDPLFEQSIDALINGRLDELQTYLRMDPGLVKRKSSFGHQATLLHYTASNGVEMWRQRVPENLPAIIRALIDSGANVHDEMVVYNGNWDTLALLSSSAHPLDAGVRQEAIIALTQDSV